MARQRILHLDMDAYFASVEVLDHPELAGRPLLVGGRGNRGVVAACSYEARRFGIHSAMPMARARRLCPEAVVMPPRKERYGTLSREIFGWLGGLVPRLEKMSVDEAYLDGSDLASDEAAYDFAAGVKREMLVRFGLVCSIGIGPSKFVAKIASDLEKPDALVLVRPGELEAFLAPLDVGRIPGVGKVGRGKLREIGVDTIAQLREQSRERLVALFGKWGANLHDYAHGIDEREVVPLRERKSHAREQTFERDLTDLAVLLEVLSRQADKLAERLEIDRQAARTVSIKLRYSDFETLTRQESFDHPVWRAEDIRAVAERLLRRSQAGRRPLRLLGVSVAGLIERREPDDELPLFIEPQG